MVDDLPLVPGEVVAGEVECLRWLAVDEGFLEADQVTLKSLWGQREWGRVEEVSQVDDLQVWEENGHVVAPVSPGKGKEKDPLAGEEKLRGGGDQNHGEAFDGAGGLAPGAEHVLLGQELSRLGTGNDHHPLGSVEGVAVGVVPVKVGIDDQADPMVGEGGESGLGLLEELLHRRVHQEKPLLALQDDVVALRSNQEGEVLPDVLEPRRLLGKERGENEEKRKERKERFPVHWNLLKENHTTSGGEG